MRGRSIIASSGVWIVLLTISLLPHSRISFAETLPSLDDLIAQLGSPDASIREASTVALARIGPAARSSLRFATQHPVPEIATRARELLGRLPFYLPDDSPDVKACLYDYESADELNREARIERLGGLATPDAYRALVRIVQDEPSVAVRWNAVSVLLKCHDGVVLAEVRELRPPRDPAQLVLVAHGWRPTDPTRSAKLLRRAMAGGAESGHSPFAVAEQIVPIFKSMNLTDDARQAFDAGYRELQAIALCPSATSGDFDRLATYLIRCNEDLPRALDLASRASAAEPENPAFLNTLAEAQYRIGNTLDAVKTQQRAAELCPNDATIESRLERFLAAIQ